MEVKEEIEISKSVAVIACTAMTFFYVAILYAPTLLLRLPQPKFFKSFMLRRFVCGTVSSIIFLILCAFILPWQAIVFPLSSSLMYAGSLVLKSFFDCSFRVGAFISFPIAASPLMSSITGTCPSLPRRLASLSLPLLSRASRASLSGDNEIQRLQFRLLGAYFVLRSSPPLILQFVFKLDLRTKLCIRDSLYCLARSAEQRHNYANLNGGPGDDKDAEHSWLREKQVHEKAAKWRYNRFPWYNDLSINFGRQDLNFDSSSLLHGALILTSLQARNLQRKEVCIQLQRLFIVLQG